MTTITFSSDYHKLYPEVKMATLLSVFRTTKDKLIQSFILYDTMKIDNTLYTVPDGELLLLLFRTHTPFYKRFHIFTTLRKWTPEKEKYYRSKIGNWFDVVIK